MGKPTRFYVEQFYEDEGSSFENFDTFVKAKRYFEKVGGRVVERSNIRDERTKYERGPVWIWDEEEILSSGETK